MALCIFAAGKTTVLVASAFTLSWTHSVEKTRWEEDWRVTPAGLSIVEARIKGSGAGMEPPADAMLKDGWWAYATKIAPQNKLVLAASGATPSGWTLCTSTDCRKLGAEAGAPVEITVCDHPRDASK